MGKMKSFLLRERFVIKMCNNISLIYCYLDRPVKCDKAKLKPEIHRFHSRTRKAHNPEVTQLYE